jgi:cytochrome bd ubiquinol oxidase subunit I
VTSVQMGRALFGMTLGFHGIFAMLGVGIPLLISLAELMGILRRDADYTLLARRWTKGFVVLVAVGVVTGTIVGFNLSLLWPQFMKQFAPAIGLPFLVEVFAFFIEAIFMAVYVYAWDRFKNPWHHWLCSLPIVAGAAASGMLITTANAFMNTPIGFIMKNGQVTDVHPLQAMWSPAAPTEVLHVVVSAYLTAAFVIAAIPAWQLWRGKSNSYLRKGLRLTMWVGLVTGVLTPLIGDAAGKFLAGHQTEKLAAGEALFHTESNASLLIGGIVHPASQTVTGAIHIPHLLSFLAHSNFTAPVTGLDAFPRWTWPPLIVHYFFDGMVGLGMYLLVVACVYFILRLKRFTPLSRRLQKPVWLLVVAGAPAALLAMELGWMFDEMGRQPWIVTGIMLVNDAFTKSLYIAPVFYGFMALYTLIGGMTVYVLLSYFRRHPLERDELWLNTHSQTTTRPTADHGGEVQ